jgi:hypothetical protein
MIRLNAGFAVGRLYSGLIDAPYGKQPYDKFYKNSLLTI